MLRARSLLPLAFVGLLACRPDPVDTVTPEPIEQVASEPSMPSPDLAKMLEHIAWLASDDLQGRFTFDPTIETSAAWLVEQYRQMGLEPIASLEGLRVPYALRTKVEAGPGSRLAVKGKSIDAKQFSPRAEGKAGTAKGELVFVGYAARLDEPKPAAAEPDEAASSEPAKPFVPYDDLAGVDVKGKIVLLLDQAPNSPDLMALFGRMQKIAEQFEQAAAPLRAKGDAAEPADLDALAKLHQKARKQLVDLVAPFADTKDLGDEFWKVEDPKAPLNMMALGSMIAGKQSGPQFDPFEHVLGAKLERLSAAGAAGVILVQGPRSFVGKDARDADELPGVLAGDPGSLMGGKRRVVPDGAAIPVVQLRWKQADKLFEIGGKKLSRVQAAIDADMKPRSQALGVEVEITTDLKDEFAEVPNVVAMLPGKTDELIVIGAHFDHIGNSQTGMCSEIVRKDKADTICNGADDNASGTAMLVELARAFVATGVTPERTIVFAHFSGEELGLLGSKALAADPRFPMERVAAMVNLDMVGRLGKQGLAIGGIHTSAQWMPLLDELGNHAMEVLYEGSTTTRSDHAWWFRKDIPVLFFFTGIHGDYHRAGDEVAEIDSEGLKKIGDLVGELIWTLAGGYAVEWQPPAEGTTGIGRGLPGSDPSSVIKRVGVDGAVLER
ncbi:M20/M25/M40 family metallo-hydrolase [Nannocystaceae bacterium ST9]